MGNSILSPIYLPGPDGGVKDLIPLQNNLLLSILSNRGQNGGLHHLKKVRCGDKLYCDIDILIDSEHLDNKKIEITEFMEILRAKSDSLALGEISRFLCGHARIFNYIRGSKKRYVLTGIDEGQMMDGNLVGYGRRIFLSQENDKVLTNHQVGFWTILEDNKGIPTGDVVPDGKFAWLQSYKKKVTMVIPMSVVRCKAERDRIRIQFCKSKPVKSLKKNYSNMPLETYGLFKSGPKIYLE